MRYLCLIIMIIFLLPGCSIDTTPPSPDSQVAMLSEEAITSSPITYTREDEKTSDVVSIEGDARHVGNLWGYESFWRNAVFGNKIYHLYAQKYLLMANSFDLNTLEQTDGQQIYDFESEEILQIIQAGQSVHVQTSLAAYVFDHNLQLQSRKPWPKSMEKHKPKFLILNQDASLVAFTGENGLYLCDLIDNAQPVLLKKHVLYNPDDKTEEHFLELAYYRAMYFIDKDRIFVQREVWEGIGALLVVDLEGNVLGNQDVFLSGDNFGGYYESNNTIALILEQRHEPEHPNTIYDLNTYKGEAADWLMLGGRLVSGYSVLADPDNPYVFYFSIRSQGFEGNETIFVKIDCENHIITKLPFILLGSYVNVQLIGIGENRNLLLHYEHQDETGFGIYQLT